MAMADYDEGDPKRIQHFTKVYYYAHLIAVGEHLPLKVRQITEIAAMVHDIGIHKAEKSFHTTAGKIQEKLGAPESVKLLRDMGFSDEIVNRVSYLVGHHHTYTGIDGIDYQILVEADFLVNIYEDNMDLQARENAFGNIFKTSTGKRLFRQMYPVE
ncbi:MAG: HD domain-containing protein [Lachnospiraceae bacterium]|nr:HD domain-containing protein [Lachnospiraceae bacterium]